MLTDRTGSGARRIRALLFAAASGLLALPAAADVSRDIRDYVLFAQDELHFKGRNGSDAGNGLIIGGNVGVNRIDPTPSSGGFLLNLGANGVTVMSPGTQIVADSMLLGGANVTAWDIFANITNSNMAGVTRNSGPVSFSGPLLSMPALPFTPGRAATNAAADVTVASNVSLVLTPGTYRDLRVQDDGELYLGAGLYDLRNFTNGKRVVVHTTDATVLQIDGEFSFNNGGVFGVGSTGLTQILAGSAGVGSNDSSVHFSRDTVAYGQFYAPNGILNLGNDTDLYGRFWAKQIGSDWNVTVHMVPVPGAGAILGLSCLVAAHRRRRV